MADARDWTLPEVALVAAGALLLLWQPAVFLNDEAAQLLGFHALSEGHLETRSLPDDYDRFAHGYAHPAVLALEGGSVVMPGSDALNVMGLPWRGLLSLLAAPLGLGAALGLLVGAAVGGATWTVARRRTGERTARVLGLAVAAALLVGATLRGDAYARGPWLDAASLHLATVLWVAVAAAAWFDLLRRTWGEWAAWAGTALWLLGTPLVFWALNVKYHGLALALQTLALWAYRDGHRTPPARTFLAAALTGLAVWNHAPSGLLLGAALVLAALPALREGAGSLRRMGAGLAGLGLGLLPVGLWRVLAARAPPSAPVSYPTSQGTFEGALWNDPGGVAQTLWQTFVWTDWFDVGVALSFLSWAPWAVLAAWTVARPDLRRQVPLWPVAVAYVVVPPLLVGDRMLQVGGGFDVRHHLAAWPLLALLAMPAVMELLRRRPSRWWTEQAAAAAAVGLAALLVVNLLWHKATGVDFVQKGPYFEAVWLHRWAGLALALLLAAAVAVPRLRARERLLAWTLASSLTLGAWVQVVVAHPPSVRTAPYVAWPVDLLSQALRWVTYSY